MDFRQGLSIVICAGLVGVFILVMTKIFTKRYVKDYMARKDHEELIEPLDDLQRRVTWLEASNYRERRANSFKSSYQSDWIRKTLAPPRLNQQEDLDWLAELNDKL